MQLTPPPFRRRVITHLVTVKQRPRSSRNTHYLRNQHSATPQTHNASRPRALASTALTDHNLLPTSDPAQTRSLSTTHFKYQSEKKLKMAGDDDYMNFLNKANEDPSAGSAQTTSKDAGKKELKASDKGADIPQPLVKATQDAFYVSDADEPFVPVSLAWEKGEGLPNEEEMAKLVDHWDPSSAEVEILDPTDWDANGQYKEIIDAVTKSGKGNDVRVYRIVKDKSRVEYFVVTRLGDGKSARLVGVKALAIES